MNKRKLRITNYVVLAMLFSFASLFYQPASRKTTPPLMMK